MIGDDDYIDIPEPNDDDFEFDELEPDDDYVEYKDIGYGPLNFNDDYRG